MPNCKNCGSRISKFDKDICPICGQIKPLEGVNSETVEITGYINIDKNEYGVKYKKRWVIFLLSFFLGPLGIQFLYLAYYKVALIFLATNAIFFTAIFLPFALSGSWLMGLIISLGIMYLVSIGIGIYFLFKQSLKDGRGELVR